MNSGSHSAGPELRRLFALFPPGTDLPEYEIVPSDEVPSPYSGLLVHAHHMTVTVEAFHGDSVDVKVLARTRDAESYSRKILLTLHHTGRVVQFGIVRVWMHYCSEPVRREILAERTPLGRILIEHDVLRRIEPTAFLRILPGPGPKAWFGMEAPQCTYGRLAIIHCDDQPAVELLEIVAPEGSNQ